MSVSTKKVKKEIKAKHATKKKVEHGWEPTEKGKQLPKGAVVMREEKRK